MKYLRSFSILLLFALFKSISSYSQEFEKVILNITDTLDLYINDGESTELYYLKLIPQIEAKGAIVVLPSA